MADLADDAEAVEVGGHLGQVVDDRGDAEQGWRTSEFLLDSIGPIVLCRMEKFLYKPQPRQVHYRDGV